MGLTANPHLQIHNVSHGVFMKNLLWLDDVRNPYLNLEGKVPQDENGDWYNVNWVLNYEQFTQWIEMFGLPDAISFDHDLADEHYTPEYFWNNYEESKIIKEIYVKGK